MPLRNARAANIPGMSNRSAFFIIWLSALMLLPF